jgi:hypothetical protein
MRTWKALLLPALAALLLTPSLRAAEPGSELSALSKKIDDLRADIQAFGSRLTDLAVVTAKNIADIRDLQRHLDDLQAQVSRMDTAQRRAFSTPPENGDSVRVPTTGTIVLRNRSLVGGTFYVNSRSYTVLPGGSVRLDMMPAGPFTYEITADGFGTIRPPTTRVLAANTTYYLNIDP